MMKISSTSAVPVCAESEIYSSILPLDNAAVLELGCGKAQHTREIAENTSVASIVAMEVDEVQHAENQKIADLPKVTFEKCGAESIASPDNSFDIVLMFKSLHHVPMALMAPALQEIKRVLKPGGLAYISEPVYAGDFNEILRMFHDEKRVRQAAFDACRQAVENGDFELVGQYFFNAPMRFAGFEDFEKSVIGATHTDHQLDDALFARVKKKFMKHVIDGDANFEMPIRVDLLRKRKVE
jgi:ubiquinone/menaquinone biosynthesis C-methylase UbiE